MKNFPTRREFLAAAAVGFPAIACSTDMLTLSFLTIPDPDGWHPHLRLKGDWLIFKISDGVLSGYGEASHSKQDEQCKQAAEALFEQHYKDFQPTLESLKAKEE